MLILLAKFRNKKYQKTGTKFKKDASRSHKTTTLVIIQDFSKIQNQTPWKLKDYIVIEIFKTLSNQNPNFMKKNISLFTE